MYNAIADSVTHLSNKNIMEQKTSHQKIINVFVHIKRKIIGTQEKTLSHNEIKIKKKTLQNLHNAKKRALSVDMQITFLIFYFLIPPITRAKEGFGQSALSFCFFSRRPFAKWSRRYLHICLN